MPAVVTPVWQEVGLGGWNTSWPAALSPASRVVVYVVPVDDVTEEITLPCSDTPASAPLVVYWITVAVPSAHCTTATPLVVLLTQLPLPVGTGSPFVPANTVPLAGAPLVDDWQPLRLPVKL
jgi:hypothetical protein